MRWLTFSVLLTITTSCSPSSQAPVAHAEGPLVITTSQQLGSAVGKQVTLRGVVVNSKIASLVGVDVESESPDLRGQAAEATGVLERETVSREALERELAEKGQFANRGAGTFYRLIDAKTGRLAQVTAPAK